MKRPTTQPAGMTAIELLVATMLASLMLGALVGLLGGLVRQERVLRNRMSLPPPWQVQLAEQIQWDLMNTRQYVASAETITLLGFGARDFATGRPTGRPAEVSYYFIDACADQWLVRRETHPDNTTNDASRIELFCRGVGRFQLATAIVEQAARSGPSGPQSAVPTPVPERVAVRLYNTTGTTPFFDRVYFTR